ncbi:unnamed protein product [Closterium sp. NIES-53]
MDPQIDGADSRLENADAAGVLLATDLALTLTPPVAASRRGDPASRIVPSRDADEVLSRSASNTRPAAEAAQLERFPTSSSRTRSPPATAGGSVVGGLGMSLDPTTTADAKRPAKAPAEALQQVRQQPQQHPEHLQESQLQEILFRSRPFSPSLLAAESAGRFSARQPSDVFLSRGATNAPNSAVPPPTRLPRFFAAPSGARAPFSGSPDSPGGSNIPSAPPTAAPLTYDAAAVVVDSVAQFLRSLGAPPAPSALPGVSPASTAPFSAPPLPLARASAPEALSAPLAPPTSAPSASGPSFADASVGSAAELAARLLGAPGRNAGGQENLALLGRLWGAAGPAAAPLAQSGSAQLPREGGNGGGELGISAAGGHFALGAVVTLAVHTYTPSQPGLDPDLTERLGAILAAASGRAAAGCSGGNAGKSLAGAVRIVAATAAASNISAAGNSMAATPTAAVSMPPTPNVTAVGTALGTAAAGVRARERMSAGQGYGEEEEREPRGAEGGEQGEAGERGTGGAEGEVEGEAASAEGGEDGEGSGNKRKMRLSQEQQSTMEAVFRKTPRLTPREKCVLAGQLGVRVRQVEVWFQNRRARTKVKDTEVELDGLRQRCQTLADENRRLKERLSQTQQQQQQAEQQEQQRRRQQGQVRDEGEQWRQTGPGSSREHTTQVTWKLCHSCESPQRPSFQAAAMSLKLTEAALPVTCMQSESGQQGLATLNGQQQQGEQQQRTLMHQLQQAVEQRIGALAETPGASNHGDGGHERDTGAGSPTGTSPGLFLKL